MDRALRLVRSLTRAGRAVVVTGFVGYALGVALGWRELLMVAAACAIAIVVGAAWVARPVPMTVTRSLLPSKVTVGGSSEAVIEVKNTSRRPSRSRVVEDAIGPNAVRLEIGGLQPNESVTARFTVPGRTRGLVSVGPVKLSRTDPLRLFHVVQAQGSTEHLWVHPRTHPMRSARSGWSKDAEGPTSDRSPQGSASFHTLREYERGDDMRHVHWRTSVRVNRLMVRKFVDVRETRELIVLDTRSSVYESDAFEDAVEIAASIARAISSAGGEPVLVTSSPVKPNTPHDVLDRLTLAMPTEETSIQDVFREIPPRTNVAGLIVITGDADAGALIAGAGTTGRGKRVILVRCRPGLKTAAMTTVGRHLVFDTPSALPLIAIWGQGVLRA